MVLITFINCREKMSVKWVVHFSVNSAFLFHVIFNFFSWWCNWAEGHFADMQHKIEIIPFYVIHCSGSFNLPVIVGCNLKNELFRCLGRNHHPHSLFHVSLADSGRSLGLTDQALLIHCSAKNILTVWHVLSITAFCFGIHRAWRRLISFKLLCNLLGIITPCG